MLSAYNLVIDITSPDPDIDEENFRAQVEPSLQHLHYLKGAFDRKPCSLTFYPPNPEKGVAGWSVRAIVLISIGAERGKHLLNLYNSITSLIDHELPYLTVEGQFSRFDFEK